MSSNLKKFKNEKAISMVSLVIIIIVLIILALAVILYSNDSVDKANKSKFLQELTDAETRVAEKRISNQVSGSDEESTNKGFLKVYVQNPPDEFVSFSNEAVYGYAIDLSVISFENSSRGHGYTSVSEDKPVVFGKDDVYVYDAKGVVYYAGGFVTEDGSYYSSLDLEKEGPEILAVRKILSANKKSVTLQIEVDPIIDGELTVTVEEKEATKKGESDGVSEYEIEVFENKTYRISAREEGAGTSTTTVKVSEIDAETYTVFYDANEGENPPEAQTKTENVVMKITQDIPTRVGYTFAGWNTDRNAEIATYRRGGDFALDGNDITLYAIWKDANRTYDLIYSANGGTGQPEALKGVREAIISNVVPVREGYSFRGWSREPKSLNEEYVAGDRIELSENLVLYATWRRSTDGLTVSIFMEVEGDNEAVNPGQVSGAGIKTRGQKVTINAKAEQGFIFKEWVVTNGGVTLTDIKNTTETFAMPDGNVEITAVFKRTSLVVRYDANKGSNAPSRVEVAYNSDITITDQMPERTGYTFEGWSLNSDASATADYKSGDQYTVKNNIIFYAVWMRKLETYSISYNLMGGAPGGGNSFLPQTKVKGVTINIYPEEPVKDGFSFKGWALVQNSDSIIYRPGEEYVKDAGSVLFAIWKDETVPTINIQVESGDETILNATGHDEGMIVGYAWTTNSNVPTNWTTILQNKDLTVPYTVKSKGDIYAWMKDSAGNYANKSVKAYEITYDKAGGTGGISKQYKIDGIPLKISSVEPTKKDFVFMGWGISSEGGSNTYQANESYNVEGDTTFTAMWGEAAFEISLDAVSLEIGGPSANVTVTKNEKTGNISITSSNTQVATATIENDIITITPGTKKGTAEIIVTEDSIAKSEKIIEIIVNKGNRIINLDSNNLTFTYGEQTRTVGYSYNGNATTTTVRSENEGVATATINGSSINVTPRGAGTTIITLTVAEDEMYLTKTATIDVIVNKKDIIVTPKANQTKVYDGTTSNQTLEYTHTGEAFSEVAAFAGSLSRAVGSDVGQYEILIGTLQLVNNGAFKKQNYNLKLSTSKVYYTITPLEVSIPAAITGQVYDGAVKYGIAANNAYNRKGDYAKTDAGEYVAIAELKDTKNYVWAGGNKTSININWSIAKKEMRTGIGGNITVSEIADIIYTSQPITPTPLVTDTDRNTSLVRDVDYVLSYKNNTSAGTATVVVTGRGNYSGVINKTFTIRKANMTVSVSNYNGTYDNAYHSITVTPTWPQTGARIYYSTSALNSSNYSTTGSTNEIRYINAIPATTVYYYIVATNFNDYTGASTVTITPRKLTNVSINNVSDMTYTGSNITQNAILRDEDLNRTLVNGTDYTATYVNNLFPGTATMTVTGKGNYTNAKQTTFNIAGDSLTVTKSTESLVTSLTVTITHSLSFTTLQYSFNNSTWTNYTGPITITADCTVYARSVHNGQVIGRSSIVIENICEHSYIAPTCTENGYCKYCGITGTLALGHDFSNKTVTSTYLDSAATCTYPAVYFYKCSRCAVKGTNTYTSGSPLGHNFTSKTTTAAYLRTSATCTTAATYYYKCSRCTAADTTYYSYGSSLGHNWGNYYNSPAATCTTAGYSKRDCIRCGATEGYATSALGHAWGSYYESVAPTCTTTGYMRRDCSRCGATEGYTTNALGHNWGSYYNSPAPTCTVNGYAKRDCSRCGATDGYTLSATGHNFAAATCTNPSICQKCGITSGSALGHSWGNYYNSPAATCTTAGYSKRDCSRCGTSTGSATAALGHNFGSYQVTTAPGCTTNGVETSYCSRCTVTQTRSLSALGHSWGGYVVTSAETCTTTGYRQRTCSRCGAKDGYSVAALGHDYAAATCTTPQTCRRCGATTGSALGHAWGGYYQSAAATCTASGYMRHDCSRCGATEGYTLAALGHNYAAATCTKAATCTRCGATSGGPLGHNYAAATCTAPATCTRCGATSGSALGHTWGGWLTIKYVNCTEDGSRVRECMVCGALDNIQTIPAWGHNYAAATCTAPKTCTTCGATTGTALGHNYAAATCTAAKKCTRCGVTSGSALGHDWVAWYVGSYPSCTASGYDNRYCNRCYTSETRTVAALGHNYAAATCTAAKTCTRCGVTSGSALGHNYSAATCTAAAKCSRCGGTSGSALGHNYSAATCTVLSTCSRCGVTTGSLKAHSWSGRTCTQNNVCKVCGKLNSYAYGHSYAPATCSSPSTCTRCGATTGSKLGHKWVYEGTNQTCSRCGIAKY